MTADLIARLRRADEYEPLGHVGWEAADRIEALVKEVKDEREAKFKMRDERDAAKIAASNYADFNHAWRKRAERLEEALKWQAEQPEAHPFMVAHALAALKGDDHE